MDGMKMIHHEKWYDNERIVSSHLRLLKSQHIGIEFQMEKMVIIEKDGNYKILRDKKWENW